MLTNRPTPAPGWIVPEHGPSLFRAVTDLAEISVEGIEVMADIGIYEHEIGQLQPLCIEVSLRVTPPAEDRLEEVFNYENVLKYAQELAQERIGLIEIFARRLGEACLAHKLVQQADVRVRKPRALAGCIAGARIVLHREPA